MKESNQPKWRTFKKDNIPITWCGICGTNVGDTSEYTGKIVTAMYDCEKCLKNYCDQCSYLNEADGMQHCLRCDTELELMFEQNKES